MKISAREGNRYGDRERDIRNCETQAGCWDAVGTCTPQHEGCGEPLKCDCRSVKGEAIAFRGFGHLHETANAAPAEQRHGGPQKYQNERKVPVHDV